MYVEKKEQSRAKKNDRPRKIGLPIYLSRIINPRPIRRATPAHKRLPAITVRFDRAEMPAAK
jgi:hypothetical protein